MTYSLYRVHFIDNASKQPVVKYDYGYDENEVLVRVLREQNLISELKIKKIADKASLLDAAAELLDKASTLLNHGDSK